MNEDERFFFSETIRHAKSLPLRDAIKFIDGFTEAVGATHPARTLLNAARQHLISSDEQLELIAIGQLTFEGLKS